MYREGIVLVGVEYISMIDDISVPKYLSLKKKKKKKEIDRIEGP
jgi:hypothetical protein